MSSLKFKALFFISIEDALVKLIAKILVGAMFLFTTILAILYVITLVLPEPGPASIMQGPSICSTASN